jgi:hypothetical protein
MNIDKLDQARIEKLGAVVSMAGDHYVVRHLALKRKKHEGGNLSALLTALQMDLDKLEKKKGNVTAPILMSQPPEHVAASELPNTDRVEPPVPPILPAQKPDKESSRAAEAPKQQQPVGMPRGMRTKRSPGDWKTYQIGKLILRNADKTPQEIFDLCKAEGIETKLMTVIGLQRYIKLTVQLLADISAEEIAT